MSGGSYDYLYLKDADELLQMEDQLQAMADRLAGLGYAEDAAKETQGLLLEVRRYRNHIQTGKNRLSHVWRAVERWDSADSGEDEVKKALSQYRGELGV